MSVWDVCEEEKQILSLPNATKTEYFFSYFLNLSKLYPQKPRNGVVGAFWRLKLNRCTLTVRRTSDPKKKHLADIFNGFGLLKRISSSTLIRGFHTQSAFACCLLLLVACCSSKQQQLINN